MVAAGPRRKREECVFPGDLARRYDAEGPVGHMDGWWQLGREGSGRSVCFRGTLPGNITQKALWGTWTGKVSALFLHLARCRGCRDRRGRLREKTRTQTAVVDTKRGHSVAETF